ncbi:MAG: hypothetical protein JO147_09720 [Actinobacteria bacterium]|nr:hypothetical protein [Actinomycetota bacterium]
MADDEDGPHAQPVVGCTGRVIVASNGRGRAGEIEVSIRGGTETFLAFCDEPLARNDVVLVVSDLGQRKVVVVPWNIGGTGHQM